MIEARGLTKRYGSALAVNDLSFTIRPGMVTGFLGPNGAGKTTTMRLIRRHRQHAGHLSRGRGETHRQHLRQARPPPSDNDNRRVIAAIKYLAS
jgi:ABC-2 type transport system ATP-binding protein